MAYAHQEPEVIFLLVVSFREDMAKKITDQTLVASMSSAFKNILSSYICFYASYAR